METIIATLNNTTVNMIIDNTIATQNHNHDLIIDNTDIIALDNQPINPEQLQEEQIPL